MIHSPFLNPFDVHGYHLINGLAGSIHMLDLVMIFFASYAPEIYAGLFIIAWFVLPRRDIQGRHGLVVACFSGILALVINVIIAHIWFRPRPFAILHKGTFTQLIHHPADASFPSDHVSGSFGFAAATWGRSHKWISYLFTSVAILVMFSRVYVGVHWPTDVIGGFLVGTFSGRLMWMFSRFLYPLTTFGAKLFKFGPPASSSQQKNM